MKRKSETEAALKDFWDPERRTGQNDMNPAVQGFAAIYPNELKKRMGTNWANCKVKNKESDKKPDELIQCGSPTPYCIVCLDGCNHFIYIECMAVESSRGEF